MIDLSYIIPDMTTQIKATNPYSGQSTMLTPEEHKLYIEIKQAEWDEDYDTVRKGLDKFSRMNADAYMTCTRSTEHLQATWYMYVAQLIKASASAHPPTQLSVHATSVRSDDRPEHHPTPLQAATKGGLKSSFVMTTRLRAVYSPSCFL